MPQLSFYEKLLAAKVPQLLGTYLAVGFGLLQFVEFVVNRYDFASVWVDRYLLLWLGLVPAIALLIYYKGLPQKGTSSGSGWKKGLILLNVGLVALASFLVKGGSSEVTTQTVALVDETGVQQERIIPAKSSVKRIAIFEFQQEKEEKNNVWYGAAYASLFEYHLRQRPEIITTGMQSLNSYYDRFGVEMFTPINVATQRKIAQRARTDYFVSAKYDVSESGHEVSGSLYRAKDGKSVKKLAVQAEDIYAVVDRLKEQIDEYLPPLGDLESAATNLPSAALITDNIEALEAYTKGLIQFNKTPSQLDLVVPHHRAAFNIDPTCGTCAYGLADKLYGQGKPDSATQLLRQAVRLSEILPEREQFGFKATLFSVTGKFDNLAKLMERQRVLYPYEYYPYARLEGYYQMTYGLDSTIHLMETAAELSDREKALGQLYTLYSEKKDFKEVERIIEVIEQEFPDPDQTRMRRASLYQKTGRLDEARDVLQEMMALDPLNLDPLLQLIKLETRNGSFNRAEALAEEMKETALTATDTINAWNALLQVYSATGRIAKAEEELAAYEKFLTRTTPVNVIVMQNYLTKAYYALITGREGRIEQLTNEVAAYDESRANMLKCYLPYYSGIYQLPYSENAALLPECTKTLSGMGKTFAGYAEVATYLLGADHAAAADYLAAKRAEGLEPATMFAEARANRLAGRLEQALEMVEEGLSESPGSPELLLELAHIQRDQGETAAALGTLKKLQNAWGAADDNFIPAQRAKALADELAG